ncbi:hypothetical protein FACS1894126_4620 [Alphaproteobacteria bacterium]|nr:hypothetical protein FACS1894126_4620 [Alphaproteobacteria bacterium]
MQFSKDKFLAGVQTIHLKSDDVPIYSAIKDDEVRAMLDEFVEYGKNPRFSDALDKICKNLVGVTMFKLMITKMIAKGKNMRIVSHNNQNDGSFYENHTVYINLSRYDKSKCDAGIESMQYYCINQEGKIENKLKSLAESIFHEFCHALHDVSETYIYKIVTICKSKGIDLVWGDDEELRTITCLDHDPICDHCFDLCQCLMTGDSFHPRYTHKSYKIGQRKQRECDMQQLLQQCLPLSKKFMDGWREYVI